MILHTPINKENNEWNFENASSIDNIVNSNKILTLKVPIKLKLGDICSHISKEHFISTIWTYNLPSDCSALINEIMNEWVKYENYA